jgi:hypothetical protein
MGKVEQLTRGGLVTFLPVEFHCWGGGMNARDRIEGRDFCF